VPRHDDVGAHELTPGSGESPEEGDGDCERGIRDDAKGSTRKSQVTAVGLDDDDARSSKSFAKLASTSRVQLEGDDACTVTKQRCGYRPGTGTDVKNEVAESNTGVVNEPLGPSTIESMPSPSCPFPGHGRPS
jgi:hypothetical protein